MPDDMIDMPDLRGVEIELATERDRPEICALFRASLDEGQVPSNDTGADLDNLVDAYFSDDGESAFWVARLDGQVIGMIGVQKTAENAAEVRRLRVREGYRRRGLGARLLAQALQFCRDHDYLKIVLDVRIERAPAISLFEKAGFRHYRTRDIDGRKMLDFLLDLYTDAGDPGTSI